MASSTASYGPNGEHAAHHGVATTTQQIEHSDSTRISQLVITIGVLALKT
jgi:hypothetical protein